MGRFRTAPTICLRHAIDSVQDIFSREAELLEQLIEPVQIHRSGHADDFAVQTDVLVPSITDSCFNRNAGSDALLAIRILCTLHLVHRTRRRQAWKPRALSCQISLLLASPIRLQNRSQSRSRQVCRRCLSGRSHLWRCWQAVRSTLLDASGFGARRSGVLGPLYSIACFQQTAVSTASQGRHTDMRGIMRKVGICSTAW